jgi:transmembrane E3 ubiquitin-protein ligase
MRYASDQAILRKKLIQFYFMFYVIMFFSLFYVMKFFFEKPYIFTAIVLTWIPQIIYNAIYKNRLSMPLMNIILMGVNKVFLPFYFRGCPENFFQLSHDYKFISICLVCLILEVKFLLKNNF